MLCSKFNITCGDKSNQNIYRLRQLKNKRKLQNKDKWVSLKAMTVEKSSLKWKELYLELSDQLGRV